MGTIGSGSTYNSAAVGLNPNWAHNQRSAFPRIDICS